MRWTAEPSVLVLRGPGGLPERLLAVTFDPGVTGHISIAGIPQLGAPFGGRPVHIEENPFLAADPSLQAHRPTGAGRRRFWVPVAEPASPVRVTVTVEGAGEQWFTLEPVRPWKVFLVHHNHLDIGYTDLQPRVMAWHNRVIDDVIRYAKADPGFVWNFEATYPLWRYLQDRPARDRQAVLELIRSGRAEVCALFAGMHTELCSAEELARTLALGARLGREYGFGITSAMHSDIAGITWQMAQVLASAGVRYLSLAPNNYRAPFHAENGGRLPRPFWWEGPDGSRVLTWYTDHPVHGYQEGNVLGFLEGEEQVLDRLPERLRELEAAGYPYDAVHLRTQGAYSDNGPANLRVSEVVRAWNEHWLWPRVELATNSAFFRHMEERWSEQIPVFRGDWPNWWADGAGSAPVQAALGRQAQAVLPAAEAMLALEAAGGGEPFPTERAESAWESLLLWDEHTWGAMGSEGEKPDGLFSGRGQWERKAALAAAAEEQAGRLLELALAGGRPPLAAPAADRACVSVTNLLAWERSGPVTVDLTRLVREGWTEFALYEEGLPVPFQVFENCGVLVAAGVPAMGRKVYELRREKPNLPLVQAASPFETPFGPQLKEGALGSLILERLEQSENRWDPSHWSLTHPVSEAGRTGPLAWRQLQAGPVAQTWEATGEIPGGPSLTHRVTLFAGLPWVGMTCEVGRAAPGGFESLSIDFPFSMPGAQAYLSIPGAAMRPGIDQVPGSCRAWYAVQDYVTLCSPELTVLWTSVDAPLVSVGNGGLRSRVWNNHWQTNFPQGHTQSGTTRFRYAFQAGHGGFDGLAAARFGEAQRLPLLGEVVDGPVHAPSRLSVEGARLLAFRPAGDGDGFFLRLAEAGGQGGSAHVRFPGLRLRRPGGGDLLSVPLSPWQICTVRVRFD